MNARDVLPEFDLEVPDSDDECIEAMKGLLEKWLRQGAGHWSIGQACSILTAVLASKAARIEIEAVGKALHAVTRRTMIQHTEHQRLPTQLGGFAFQQTSFASAWLRSFCRLATSANLSVATLFVDVRHAFHSLLRENGAENQYGTP